MSTISFHCVICGTALRAAADTQHDLMECHSCSHYVPVPRPASLRGKFTACQSVLPPGVLELTVTFLCTECSSRLRTDARWEGREIGCPDCGKTTRVPRWSTVPNWPRSAGSREFGSPAAVDMKVAALTFDEIEFLRGTESMKPEAA